MQFSSEREHYFNLGFNVSCISYLKNTYNANEKNPEKSPSHDWIELQIKRQSREEQSSYPWKYAVGVGCILGYDDVLCIDIDDCADVSVIKNILGLMNLGEDYPWVVKTPKGYHIFVNSDPWNLPRGINNKGIICLTPNQEHVGRFSRIEYRFAGHVVLPPSRLPNIYKFLNGTLPEKAPRYIRPLLLYQVMAYLSGARGPVNTSPSSYAAKLGIGNLTFSFTENSDFNEFTVSKGQEIVFNEERHYLDEAIKKKGRSICYLDVETTGLIIDTLNYSQYPRLIQLSYVIENSNGEISEVNHFIKPDGYKVSSEVVNLTGISNEFLIDNGHSLDKALDRLQSDLYDIDLVVMHNAEFDISVLDAEYLRLRRRNPLRDNQHYCTMKAYADYNDVKYPRLSELYALLFAKHPTHTLHNALNDVYILRSCYKLMDLYGYCSILPLVDENKSKLDLDDLIAF